MKQMILNASATSSKFAAKETTAEPLDVVNCSCLARSQTMLNFCLNKAKCHADTPLSLDAALAGGHWIVREYTDPGHFSLLNLGNSLLNNKSNASEKENLKLRW